MKSFQKQNRVTKTAFTWGVMKKAMMICILLLSAGCSDSDPQLDGGASEGGLGSCAAGTCKGCCQQGQCLPGTAATACGTLGFSCTACPGGYACSEGGVCAPDGSACKDCTSGCCSGSACEPGTSVTACGAGGALCTTCGTSQKCESGQCVCDPATCDGCCADGVCHPGTEDEACGAKGTICSKCSSSTACEAGTCGGSAGCKDCKGCCRNGTCEPGNTKTACGKDGAVCIGCGGGELCDGASGTCNDPSSCGPGSCTGCCANSQCEAGNTPAKCGVAGDVCRACAVYQTCGSKGTCEVDPKSKWAFTVISATLDPDNPWDKVWNVKPDPYVKLKVGSETGKTSSKNNETSPKWNETVLTVTAAELLKSNLIFSVIDDDFGLTGDEEIASCTVQFGQALFSGKSRTFGWFCTATKKEMSELKVRMVYKP